MIIEIIQNPHYIIDFNSYEGLRNISVTGNDELYVAYFNYNGAATTGGFYSGFSRPPKIDFDIELETLGSCIKKDGESNITLKASDISNFTSIVWEYLENGNFISTGITTNEFTPTQSGTYRLKGILDCSESTFVSNETTVFICADDFDNDGKITQRNAYWNASLLK